MSAKTIIGLATAGALMSYLAMAQPPGLGEAAQSRGRGDHWQRMGDYLELNESQQAEWQQVLDVHRDETSDRFETIRIMRQEFNRLAEDGSPDLMVLGQLALDMHREMEAAKSSRQATEDALKATLTPEQIERFDSLREAREAMGPRFGRHGQRHWEEEDGFDE